MAAHLRPVSTQPASWWCPGRRRKLRSRRRAARPRPRPSGSAVRGSRGSPANRRSRPTRPPLITDLITNPMHTLPARRDHNRRVMQFAATRNRHRCHQTTIVPDHLQHPPPRDSSGVTRHRTTTPNAAALTKLAHAERHVVVRRKRPATGRRRPRPGDDPTVSVRVGVRVAGSSGFHEQRQPGTAGQPWPYLGTDWARARGRRCVNGVHRTAIRPSRHSGMVTRRASTLHRSRPGRRRSPARRPAPRQSL